MEKEVWHEGHRKGGLDKEEHRGNKKQPRYGVRKRRGKLMQDGLNLFNKDVKPVFKSEKKLFGNGYS